MQPESLSIYLSICPLLFIRYSLSELPEMGYDLAGKNLISNVEKQLSPAKKNLALLLESLAFVVHS